MATVTLKETPVHLIGNLPPLQTQAPDFIVTKTDLSELSLKNFLGKKFILSVFPSLDTPTCAASMRHFNDIAARFPDVTILCVSADLPFAQKRFCVAEHLNNIIPVSVFRHPSFGTDYGVTITDGPLAGLLSRAIIVVDEQGKVCYTELVRELSNEPNYEAAIGALGKETKQPIN